MAELHDRFRSLDRIAVPDLWADVEQRAVASAPRPLGRVSAPRSWLGRTVSPSGRAWRLAMVAGFLIVALIFLMLLFGAGRVRLSTPFVFSVSSVYSGSSSARDGLYAVDAAGGRPRRVVEGFAQGIHVSPDGRYVFFEAHRGATTGLAIARTDGSSVRSLPDPGDYQLGRVWETVWAADSHAAAWISWQAGRARLMVAEVDGSEPRAIDVPPTRDPHFAWSPDSVHLAYYDRGECGSTASRHLYIVDTITDKTRELGSELDAQLIPVWAHDGRHLAVAVGSGPLVGPDHPAGDPNGVTCAAGTGTELIVVGDIDAGTTTVVAAGVDAFTLSWSDDDRMIRWTGPASPAGLAIFSVPANGGDTQELAHLDADNPPERWSSDGTRLTWTAWDGGMDSLWVIDLAVGQPRRIARNLGANSPEGWPMWSPDGGWIAFPRAPSDPQVILGGALSISGSIYIVRPDGSDEQLLVDDASGVNLAEVGW